MKKFAILAALAATPTFADQPVTINFAAEIGGQPFACDATYAGLGSTAAEVKGTDFRLYISDVAMVAADGSRTPVSLDESDDDLAGAANGSPPPFMTDASQIATAYHRHFAVT